MSYSGSVDDGSDVQLGFDGNPAPPEYTPWQEFAMVASDTLTGIPDHAFTSGGKDIRAAYGKLIRVAARHIQYGDSAIDLWMDFVNEMKNTGQWRFVREQNAWELFGRWCSNRGSATVVARL